MIRNIAKALLDGTACAIPIWLTSQIGILVFFYTYQIGGAVLYPVFYVLAFWPNIILRLFLPKGYLSDYSDAYTIDCLMSLVGWILLCNLIALIWHVVRRSEKKTSTRKLL